MKIQNQRLPRRRPGANPVRRLYALLFLASALCLSSVSIQAQPVVVTNLYNFKVTPDGNHPMSLTYGAGGELYGITFLGGANDAGTIFKINRDGTGETILHSFNVGDGGITDFFPPVGNNLTLLQGNDGLLYGTTSGGGANGDGTVFKLYPDGGGYTVIHSFTNSDAAPVSLIQGNDGALYGAGGSIFIFKLNTDGGGYTILHSGNEGGLPLGLMQGKDGALYGTTFVGGAASQFGTVFKLDINGGYTVLHTFSGAPGDGLDPAGAPFQASNGTLYGTTYSGGASNVGTIYQINPDGNGYMVLHHFAGTSAGDGQSPLGRLAQDFDNQLYGTTGGSVGTIFKIGLDGNGYEILVNFANIFPGGSGPTSGLAPGPASDGSGAFYGTTTTASPTGLNGTVFVMLVNPPTTIIPIGSQTVNGQTVVFWPSWAVGYKLQATTNLASPNWFTVSNAVPLTGAQVTNNLPASYFRLVWP